MALTKNALSVLKKRYLQTNEDGTQETPEEMFHRVATTVANHVGTSHFQSFFDMMVSGDFLPSTPILLNAGRTDMKGNPIKGMMFACHVYPLRDTLFEEDEHGVPGEGILDILRMTGITHKYGGGTGFDFSELRPEGYTLNSTGGKSSGPISFLRIFNAMTQEIKQGGFRRGANMGVLRIDHPDIIDWIRAKQETDKVNGFNLSVAVTDEFMKTLSEDPDKCCKSKLRDGWGDGHPRILREKIRDSFGNVSGHDPHVWTTGELWSLLVESAHANGEPGVLFIDKINKDNPMPHIGDLCATNPCVTGDTWTMTSEGPRQVFDLLGNRCDLVVDSSVVQTNGFFKTGTKKVVCLTTHRGYSLTLTPDHLVNCVEKMSRSSVETVWKRAGDLVSGDKIKLQEHVGQWWVGHGCFDEGLLTGLAVGDGQIHEEGTILSSWGDAGITNQIVESFAVVEGESGLDDGTRKFGSVVKGRGEWRVKSKPLKRLMARLGIVAGNKTITDRVEECSSNFYRGFLNGLFSADGSVQGDQSKGVSLRLSQSNYELLQRAQRMLARLGVNSSIYKRRDAGDRLMPNGNGGNSYYHCMAQYELVVANASLFVFDERIGLASKDKAKKLKESLASYKRTPNRERWVDTVVSVEPAGVDDVFDVSVPGVNRFDANGLDVHNCGEQPLLPWEVCCLGSINLENFVDADGSFDYERSREVTHTAVRFLDGVIDVSPYSHPKIEEMAKGGRKIGLGVMGFANALMRMGIVYGEPESFVFASEVMENINFAAFYTSKKLAVEEATAGGGNSGAYLFFREGKDPVPVRNSCRTTIAPTGSISILANTSSGIEPVFALVMQRRQADSIMHEVNPVFEDWLDGLDPEERQKMLDAALDPASAKLDHKDVFPDCFITAQEIAPEDHVSMQAAFQEFTDNAISKTINLPSGASVDEVASILHLAYDTGCKGVTVYRDGSRGDQPLSVADSAPKEVEEVAPSEKSVPNELGAKIYRYLTYHGKVYVIIGYDDDGSIVNCFVVPSKPGPEVNATSQAIGRQVSLLRKYNVPVQEIAAELLGIVGEPVVSGPYNANSIADAVGKALMAHGDIKPSEILTGSTGGSCPDCGQALIWEELCKHCSNPSCGWSGC